MCRSMRCFSTRTATEGAMKAAVHRRYGSPDVVTIDEVRKPVPADDEVLIRVHAATVGIVDSLARRGSPNATTNEQASRAMVASAVHSAALR